MSFGFQGIISHNDDILLIDHVLFRPRQFGVSPSMESQLSDWLQKQLVSKVLSKSNKRKLLFFTFKSNRTYLNFLPNTLVGDKEYEEKMKEYRSEIIFDSLYSIINDVIIAEVLHICQESIAEFQAIPREEPKDDENTRILALINSNLEDSKNIETQGFNKLLEEMLNMKEKQQMYAELLKAELDANKNTKVQDVTSTDEEKWRQAFEEVKRELLSSSRLSMQKEFEQKAAIALLEQRLKSLAEMKSAEKPYSIQDMKDLVQELLSKLSLPGERTPEYIIRVENDIQLVQERLEQLSLASPVKEQVIVVEEEEAVSEELIMDTLETSMIEAQKVRTERYGALLCFRTPT